MTEIFWNEQLAYPILAILQLLPLLAMVVIPVMRGSSLLFPVAMVFAVLELLLAVDLYRHFDHTHAAFQFAEFLPVLPLMNYHVAADGVSVLFMLLTALLVLLVVMYGYVRELKPFSTFFTVVFAIEATLMSMFVAVDMLWFVLISAIQLILVGYLLWRWATSPEKDLMFIRFLQFMGTGLLLLLVGMVMLGWSYVDSTGNAWTFDLFTLASIPVEKPIQSVVFFLLFYGFAVRVPLFPMHGWLPLAAEHGNVAVAPVFLLGLKVGVFGLLRFVLPVMPEAVFQWHGYVVAFAIAGIFYAALMAMMQVNLRRLLAFAVVSHTSILILGLFSLEHGAFMGSVLLSVNFGLAIAGLTFMTGMVLRRTRTTLLERLGGLFDHIPLVGITFLLAGLAIVGMPGTPGFDAAHLILEAAMKRFGALVTIAGALGNVIAAGFLLWAFQRAFLAPAVEAERAPREIAPISTIEKLIAGILVVVLLGTGFYSEPWLELIETSLEGLNNIYSGHHG